LTRAYRRDLAFAAALLLCLGGYGVSASSLPMLRAVLAVAGFGIVVIHTMGADEVRRASAFRAGFTAFVLAAGICVGATVLGRTDLVAGRAGELWAWLFVLYLISWIGHALARS
jgi:anaerobic C4-dicarboxylate transporter